MFCYSSFQRKKTTTKIWNNNNVNHPCLFSTSWESRCKPQFILVTVRLIILGWGPMTANNPTDEVPLSKRLKPIQLYRCCTSLYVTSDLNKPNQVRAETCFHCSIFKGRFKMEKAEKKRDNKRLKDSGGPHCRRSSGTVRRQKWPS